MWWSLQKFLAPLLRSPVCISVFWPDFITLSGLLPKRRAPALGNKRESPTAIARACVYLPIHVGTFTLDGLGNTHRMIELWVTGPKRMINTQIHLVRKHGQCGFNIAMMPISKNQQSFCLHLKWLLGASYGAKRQSPCLCNDLHPGCFVGKFSHKWNLQFISHIYQNDLAENIAI